MRGRNLGASDRPQYSVQLRDWRPTPGFQPVFLKGDKAVRHPRHRSTLPCRRRNRTTVNLRPAGREPATNPARSLAAIAERFIATARCRTRRVNLATAVTWRGPPPRQVGARRWMAENSDASTFSKQTTPLRGLSIRDCARNPAAGESSGSIGRYPSDHRRPAHHRMFHDRIAWCARGAPPRGSRCASALSRAVG